jgi:hypothetical protein
VQLVDFLSINEVVTNGFESFDLRGFFFFVHIPMFKTRFFSILKAGLKFGLSGEKIDRKTQIEYPIDDKSIYFVKGIECCICKVQFEVQSLGGDVCPRFHKGVEDDYDRYECNLCFKGLCEIEKICV